MAGATFNFKIDGLHGLNIDIREWGEKVTNLKTPMQESTKQVKEWTETAVFATEGGAIGEAWPSGKSYHGLIVTGNMAGNFKNEAKRMSGMVFNPTSYFKYHQSTRPRTKMPYRPMLLWVEKNIDIAFKVFQAWLAKIRWG